MITTGAKYWFAVTGLALVAFVAYHLASGGVEPYGDLVLVALALASLTIGITVVAVRDGAVLGGGGAAGSVAGSGATDDVPPRSALAAPWPALGAVGVAVAVVGLAAGGVLFWVGIAILGIVLVEWMVQGWAERATVDPGFNAALRRRIMNPVEIPALAVIGIGLVVIAFSRVLLAVPAVGSSAIAIVVAILILGGASLVASRPRITSSLVTVVVVVAAVGLVGGGIVGAVAGEREFEEHEGEGGGGGEEGGERGEVFVIAAEGTDAFTPSELRVPAGQAFTIRFENRQEDQTHNLALQAGPGEADDLITAELEGGDSATIEVPPLETGQYTYISSIHTEMQGTLVVVESSGGDADAEGTGDVPVEPGAQPADPDAADEDPSSEEQSENSDGGDTDTDSTTEVSSAPGGGEG